MVAGAYSPFLSSYYASIGLSATETGVLLVISPLAILFIQPLWARLSDRSGHRKLVLAALAAATALTSLLYYAGEGFVAALLATISFMVFFSALLPLCDALVIEGCERDGVEFARVRMGGTCGYAFVVFIVGSFLEAHPQAQFALVCALSVVFMLSVLALPMARREQTLGRRGEAAEAETPDRRSSVTSVDEGAGSGGAPAVPAADDAFLGIFRDREVIFILAFAFVSQMGLGFSGSFLGRYVVELGYGQGLVGTLSAVSALSELPILLFADRIVRRFGEIPLLIASCFFMALRLAFIGMGLVPTMVLGQLMQSVTYMTVYYSCTRYVASHVLPGNQSQGQGVLVMVQSGAAMLVANLAGGAMGEVLGMRSAFFFSAVLVLAGTLAALAAYRIFKRGAAGGAARQPIP